MSTLEFPVQASFPEITSNLVQSITDGECVEITDKIRRNIAVKFSFIPNGVICNVPNGDYDSPKEMNGSTAWLLPE